MQPEKRAAPTLPRVKPIERMDKDEYAAFLSGLWDGIDRRSADRNSKEYTKAARKKGRRRSDIRMKIVHYTTQVVLLVILAVSYYVASQNWKGW